MASIKSQLVLTDGMTGPLKSINKALNLVLSSFEATQRASGKAINTASITSARTELARASAQIEEMERNLQDCSNAQNTFNNNISKGKSQADGLLGKIKTLAKTYVGLKTLGTLVSTSDTLTSNRARLSLLVDDEGSVAELEKKIYASAQNARALYTDTMGTVAKLGLVAGKAFTDASGKLNTDELVKFTELVNKNFVVGGASSQEQSAAMYQLTQALGSGRLQGDEYRSIIENAPLLAKSIEDYMRNVQGVQGTMKEWAADGKLTADAIKAAVFRSADEVEERFNEMPMTWSQVWTNMQNRAISALDPVLAKINELANDSDVQAAIDGIINAIAILGVIALNTFGVLSKIYTFVANNWGRIAPIIMGIAAAFILYNSVLAIHKGIQLVNIALKKLEQIQSYKQAKAILAQAAAHGVNTKSIIDMAASRGVDAAAATAQAGAAGLAAAGLTAQQVAAAGATVAQTGLNTAIWACPITWIIALVIVLIVLIAVFFEQVVGAIWWLGALFKNVGLWIANVAIAIWNSIKNIGLWFANLGLSIWAVIKNIGLWFANLGMSVWAIIKNTGLWFANLGMGIWNVLKAACSNVGTAFHNAWISIQIGFWSMLDAIMQGLKSLAEKANKCLGWMGVNIDTSGLDFASKKIDDLNSKKESYTSISDAWAEGFNTFQYDSVSEAYNTFEYDSVGDAWNTNDIDWAGGWSDGYNTFDTFQEGWGSEAYSAGAQIGKNIKDSVGNALSLDNITKQLGIDTTEGEYGDLLAGIGDDTSSIASSTKNSDEDLAYLRDIAEMEAINRFTTAEVKIDMTGMTNKIDSSMDLDGVLTVLTEGFAEALETAAEGVHS